MRALGALAGLLSLAGCDVVGSDAMPGEADDPGGAGELVFLEEHGPPDFRVAVLDLDTLEVETLFTIPSGGFAYAVDVHPQTGAVLLAYTEPAAAGEAGFDRSVIVELDDAGPRVVAGTDAPGSWALRPTWSADGESIWYVAQGPGFSSESLPHTLVRVDRRTGEREREIPWATEPAVSADGRHVAWVAVEPETYRRAVVLASADGDPIRTLVAAADVPDLGLPTFSSDGRGVFVSVLEGTVTMRSADLRGPVRAIEHGVHRLPADWYGVAIDGTELEPVADLSAIQYDATVSRSEWTLLAASAEGIERVDIATGIAERVLSSRAIRSVAWRAR